MAAHRETARRSGAVATGAFAIDAIAVPELGNTGYLISSGDEAVVVDAPRVVDAFIEKAAHRGARITHVLDTHLHNDFVSGARELAERTGARVVAPLQGDYAFPHLAVREGDEVEVGDALIAVIETPGHTPEHLCYLVTIGGDPQPAAALTGGSLLVGNAGRSDLLGPDRADELGRAQFTSLHRLAQLPGAVRVLPTHGAGSFCVAIGGDAWERTSTVEQERERNPLLAVVDVDAFLATRGDGLMPIPAYYAHIAPINREGPSSTPPTSPPPIGPQRVEALVADGAWVLDLRERMSFCRAHLPGSIGVELDGSMPSRVGSIVPFDTPLVLVVDPVSDASIRRATVELARVGFDRIPGYLAGGIEAWRAGGRAVASLDPATSDDLWEAMHEEDPPIVLDVRMPLEWEEGVPIDDALTVHFGDLPARIAELPRDRELWTLCSAGQRATIAASLLQREGFTVRPVATGGALDLLDMQGND